VKVYNAPKTVVIVLQLDPIADRSEVIAESRNARWLNTRKHALHTV